jgi:dephospho-CoA kinase
MSKPFCGSGSLPSAGDVVRPYLVGITGSRATGKSVVGEILQERHGEIVIDTDLITHDLLSGPCEAYHEVLARFGTDLVDAENGPIDRDRLRARAFESDEAKASLESIMFPRISERLEAYVAHYGSEGKRILFMLAPLLHEAGMKDHFDEVWCVVAKEQVRMERLKARDNVDEAEAARLISLQMSQTEKAKLSDHLIDNSFDIETTAARVAELHGPVIERAEKHVAASASASAGADASAEADTTPPGDELVEPPSGETDSEPASAGDGAGTPKDDKPAEPGDDDANARYREYLRHAAGVGADEALAQLGDVAGTEHQEATAHLSLTVDRSSDTAGEKLARQFDVEVKMSARNKPGKPDEPNPPSPPPPVEGENSKKQRDNSRLVLLFGFLGFLAFLFGCILLWTWHNHDHGKATGSGSVTVINNIPGCADCKPTEPPTKPVEPPPPVVEPGPFNPPAEPPVAQPGVKQEFTEVPGFAFRFVHNAVRVQVARWEVTYGSGFQWAKVSGYDADRRLVVYQEYDSSQYMTFQLVMSYYRDGAVQVDRFEGRGNIFTGRSIYRVSSTGSVVRAEHYTGLKRLLYVVVIVRNDAGTPVALTVEEFDASGNSIAKTKVDGAAAVSDFMRVRFYAFDWFGQP